MRLLPVFRTQLRWVGAVSASLIWLGSLAITACAPESVSPDPPPLDVAKYTQAPYVCTPPVGTPSFQNDVLPILRTHCVDCHRPSEAYGGVTLMSYEAVRPYAASVRLLGVVAHAPLYPQMPYGRARLSDCEIGIIATWILSGYPNN